VSKQLLGDGIDVGVGSGDGERVDGVCAPLHSSLTSEGQIAICAKPGKHPVKELPELLRD
jgi:hypothetical protein